METETYSDDEDIPTPAPDEYDFTSPGGGMFAGSRDFTIVGGTFNNIMKNYHAAPTVPADFRMIPMGDIDLQKQLMVNKESGVVESRGKRRCARRVYSAKVYSRKSHLTVAVYQGNGAEEDWRRDTEMYMSVRHPNVIQICGGAIYGNMHATIFHGDLVPLEAFLARQSPIMTVYLCMCYGEEWHRVYNYFKSLQMDVRYPGFAEWSSWIRCSTGRLSVDPVRIDTHAMLALCFGYTPDETSLPQALTPSDPSNVTEVFAINSLTLRHYHRICFGYLGQDRVDFISTSLTISLGAIISWSPQHHYEEHVEIAQLTDVKVHYQGWVSSGPSELPENDWSRYRADDVFKNEIIFWVSSFHPEHWLSQANHIFSCLQIMSNLEDYVRVENLYFTLEIGDAKGVPPTGFLFLCPSNDFRTGPTSFRWPNRPAYWSLDPNGIEILSTEEATRLGFPSFQLTTKIHGTAWDISVYNGLRQFHQAKGFDPDRQGVARHLGYPLYELSRDVDPPLAHGESPCQVNRFPPISSFKPRNEVDDFYEPEETAGDADTDDEWADAQSSLHEGGCDEGSDAGNDLGKDSICIEQQGKPREARPLRAFTIRASPPEVDQGSMDDGSHNTNHKAHLKAQTPNDRAIGGSFIHRIVGALRHGLDVDADNIDTYPISPFLV